MPAPEPTLTKSDTWRERLGVLPVPLKENDRRRFVMLNGARGNFCLDASGDEAPAARATAWSADVGHYVHLLNGSVVVYRWDESRSHTVSVSLVESSIDRFQQFLEQDEPQPDRTVVRHVLSVLDRLRSITTVGSGSDALNALLVLLACVDSNCTPSDIDVDRYALEKQALSVARSINVSTWRELEAALRSPAAMPGVNLEVAIALRHSAGQLFQEAHWRTTDSTAQTMIPGILPAQAHVARGQSDATGVYFTPAPIARTLVERSLHSFDVSRPEMRVFDPACGSGEFLAESARQLRQQGYSGRIVLSGYDLSPRAVATARFVLFSQFAKDSRNTINIEVADSLQSKCEWPEGVDLLFMNPPFLSWWNMTHEQREQVRTIVGNSMRAKPDHSAAFMKRALMSKARSIGTVLITSCLDSGSFKELRREWLDAYNVAFVARLGNLSLFRTATVDSALVVGRHGITGTESTMLWTDQRAASVSSGLRALRRSSDAWRGDGYSIYVDHIDTSSSDWSPRPLEALKLLAVNRAVPTVCDLFDVRQGVITGLNAAFVLSSEAYEQLDHAEKKLFRPALLNSTVRDAQLRLTHYVWYPYAQGLPLFTSEKQVRDGVPHYYRLYLQPRKEGLSKRRGMKQRWWELIWPRLEREGTKIVTTYYGDVGSFAFDHEDRYAVVQGYSWYPKKTYQALFEGGVAYSYVALLNTRTFILALSGHARLVAGGQADLSKRFLAQTPLPNLFEGVDPQVVNELMRYGRAMSAGEHIDRARLEVIAKSVYSNG